jgi:hypothetical protein
VAVAVDVELVPLLEQAASSRATPTSSVSW